MLELYTTYASEPRQLLGEIGELADRLRSPPWPFALAAAVRQTRPASEAAARAPAARRSRRQLLCAHAPAAAPLLQASCIFELIVVKGMRQRHEQAGPADRHQLGNGRGARAGDDEMRVGDALGQVAEEGRHMGGDAGLLVGLAQFVEILLARLLHHASAAPASRRGSS